MSGFIDQVITIIQTNQTDALDISIGHAVYAFEKQRGLGQDMTIAEQIAHFGWSEAIAATSITTEDSMRLRQALIGFTQQHPESHQVGGALFALGKLFDPLLKPVFIAALQTQLDHDPGALFQAMIALDNIREDVFGESGSHSIVDTEANQRCARAYLQRQGLIP